MTQSKDPFSEKINAIFDEYETDSLFLSDDNQIFATPEAAKTHLDLTGFGFSIILRRGAAQKWKNSRSQ